MDLQQLIVQKRKLEEELQELYIKMNKTVSVRNFEFIRTFMGDTTVLLMKNNNSSIDTMAKAEWEKFKQVGDSIFELGE